MRDQQCRDIAEYGTGNDANEELLDQFEGR